MNFEKLIENLNNPKPQARLASVFILGMVNEVRAIDAMRKRYARESNHQVKQAIQTVGGMLAKLKREGYDTSDAICEHFGVYKEVLAAKGVDEEAKVRQIQKDTTHNKKDDDFNDQMWSAAAGMLQVGVVASGLGGTMSMNTANVDMTSNLSNTSDILKQQQKRLRPIRPSNEDISLWVGRLQTESDPETRIQLIIHIANMHNPAALPYLANLFWTDEDEGVKSNAKKYGTLLYRNALYWEMTQNGTIEKMMQDKAAELGITLLEENTITLEPDKPAHQESIADILAKAEAKRQKKNKRR